MTSHRIRLAGPWQLDWLSPQEARGERTATVKLPQSWSQLFAQRAGMARFTRAFHCPTNLDADEAVWLDFSGICGEGTVRLNGEELCAFLPEATTLQFDVTARLQPRNQIAVDLLYDPAVMPAPGGLYDAVALRIEQRPS